MAGHKDKKGMVRVNFLVESESIAAIDDLASEAGISRAEYCRALIIAAARKPIIVYRPDFIISPPIESISSKLPAKPDPEKTAAGQADKSKVDPQVDEAADSTLGVVRQRTKRGSALE